MKKLKIALSVLLVTSLLSGCALIPKRIEFGQKKVQAVPDWSPEAKEHLRQASQFERERLKAAELAGALTKADPSVTGPVADASTLSDAIADVVGPPKVRWDDKAALLAEDMNHDHAVLNVKLAKYAATVQPEVGKKIEGTGWFSVSYFTYLGGFLVLGALAWSALKVYGTMNPAVGLGVNMVGKVASKVLSNGFSELVAGGEAFKQYVEASPLTADVKAYVKSLFVQAHTSNQSIDTQDIVDQLTNRPSGITAPPITPAPITPYYAAPAPVIPSVVAVPVPGSSTITPNPAPTAT